MSINQMKSSKGKDAQYMRAWLTELAPEERFSAREVGDAMSERFPNVAFGTLKSRWQTLLRRGMVVSDQSLGRSWEYWLTEEGVEFWKWMMNTEEGRAWGKGDRKVKRKEERKPGERVSEDLPTGPIVLDHVSADSNGLLVAYVPAGVDIIWVEEIEQEDGSIKKKPHKIKRKSEEVLTEAEQLKARLRELGEDI